MAAEPNVAGMARLLYLVAGTAVASWGLWGADQGWTQWSWLALEGRFWFSVMIGYSPLHALLAKKNQKAS